MRYKGGLDKKRIRSLLLASFKSSDFGTSCIVASYRNARGATLLASLKSKLSDSAALRYLRPARLRLAAVRRWQILSSPSKKEKYGTPEWVFHAILKANLSLNLTPMWRKCASALGASHIARLTTSRHGATLLTSLENKLSESVSLRYLRRRFATSRR